MAKHKRWLELSNSQMLLLDRERQKFTAVAGQSDTLVFVADKEHTAHWTNASLKSRLEELGSEKVTGLSVQEIWDLLGVDCAPSSSRDCPVARVFRDGNVGHHESKQDTRDGTRILYLTFLPVKGVDGRTAEVLVLIQDLSELDTLKRSETRYRQLFERSPNTMIMASPDTGRILMANLAACTLTGYSWRELADISLEDLHEPDDWARARKEYARIVKRDEVRRFQRQLRCKEGRTISANVTSYRFELGGQPVVLLDLQDVTKQRQLEAELRQSQKMEVIGLLAAGISHEFNNIMTVILAQAELIKARAGEGEALIEIAETTERAATRAAGLTRKLLVISRKEMARKEVLDFCGAIRDIEGLLRNLLGERVLLHVDLCDEPCFIEGDPAQIEGVLINLAANARDAMTQGGNFWLEISCSDPPHPSSPGQVRLTVRDDGAGMDEETKARLFEPFFTTKAAHAGTGLGMSTVQRILEDHNASIEVESEPDAGTTFRISFQRVMMSTWKPRSSLLPETHARGQERILIVDDDPEVRKNAASLLEMDGYEIEVAGSSEEALEICEKAAVPFHLLITDIVMPGMSGGELAEKMKTRFPATRILYMSGYTDDVVEQHGIAVPQTTFLQKPFTRATISRKVREILDSPAPEDG
jgi:PAS domain S-box-containing protein